ncbi:MAG: hypothetical protein K1Y01_06590 [Vicinamibacteria bacterium]|nr:hypothetical protein [Vicinamibacteria bacterium]
MIQLEGAWVRWEMRVAVAFVGDFEEVEAAAIEITGAGEDLVLEAWFGGEEAFVEEVGGEGGDGWGQTPGDGEEDAAVFGDGEGGGPLLGVAQEDDGAGFALGEGHLGRFVDEEDVDGVRELLARPHPHGAADHVGGAGLEGLERRLVGGEGGDHRMGTVHLVFVAFVGYGDGVVRGQVQDCLEEVQDRGRGPWMARTPSSM